MVFENFRESNGWLMVNCGLLRSLIQAPQATAQSSFSFISFSTLSKEQPLTIPLPLPEKIPPENVCILPNNQYYL